MWQDEDAGEPLDCLERERPLTLEVDPAAIAACQKLGVARFGLREATLGAGELLSRGPPLSAISTAKSRSWITCPSPSTTRAR
jgi:hypothetical protein